MSPIIFTVFGDCLAEASRAAIIIFQPLSVRFPHQVSDWVIIVRILSKNRIRVGEEAEIWETDYGVIDSICEGEEVDEAYGCKGQEEVE